MKLRVTLLLAALAAAGAVGRAHAAAPGAHGLRAGVAVVRITPELTRKVYIAGYESNRIAESVHDDLYARALVLDDGTTRVAVAACDLIGLSNWRIRKIRARVTAVPADQVIVACTHVHSGPDTLGLWGPSAFQTGLDAEYLTRLETDVAAAVDRAAGSLRPVTLSVGTVQVPDGLVYNSREPIQDKTLTALRFSDAEGHTVATVVNYGGHPEVNKSKAITADFVQPVRDAVERRFGGTCVFLQGALGGMVTAQISEHTWEELQRVGEGVGKAAVAALEHARREPDPRLSVRKKAVLLPLENAKFKIAIGAKILDGEIQDSTVPTEVWRFDLGRVTWITIPGEILPRPALALKGQMPGPYPMIVALGNDELGYILDPDDFDKKLYSYERSMSVGKNTWPVLFAAARELLGQHP